MPLNPSKIRRAMVNQKNGAKGGESGFFFSGYMDAAPPVVATLGNMGISSECRILDDLRRIDAARA